MQITQFIIDISIVFFASTLLFTYRAKADRYPFFPSSLIPSFLSEKLPECAPATASPSPPLAFPS
jgi:hypothetical protein